MAFIAPPDQMVSSWSRETTASFINYFHEQPALWKVQSNEYKNKDVRRKSLKYVIEAMKRHNISLNEDGVKKKINTLRSQFRKELRTFASKKSGMSADEVYTPTLWCFHKLLFLRDGDEPRTSTYTPDYTPAVPSCSTSNLEAQESLFISHPERLHSGTRNANLEYVSSVQKSKKRKTPEEPSFGTKQLKIDEAMSPLATQRIQVKQEDEDEAITNFIVDGIHPFTTVEEPSFVSLLTSLIKGELLSEGKTKQIYAVKDDPYHVIVVNKDRITAHNAQIAHDLEGKAECSNATNAKIFKYLNTAGVNTSFRRLLDETSYLARRCRMVPIEWVTRRIATGSFLKRNPGVEEGFRFSPIKLETFFKDDAANDPEWSKAQVLSISLPELDGPVQEWQYNTMASATIAVFEILERAWASQRCTLVDMKIEFGIDAETGEILLSDVIDNDSWRLWENGKKELMKDKQVYRNLEDFSVEEMKKVKVNYSWVKDKLDGFTDGPQNTVVLLMGSASDAPLGEDIKKHCDKLYLKLTRRVMSAHKVTEETLNTVRYYNSLPTPVVYIAVAGRSNGLGPVVAGNTALPVINCPPVKKQEQTHDVWSSLSVPSGLGCSTVIYPETAVLHAASIFGLSDHRVWSRLRGLQLQRELALQKADQALQEQDMP